MLQLNLLRLLCWSDPPAPLETPHLATRLRSVRLRLRRLVSCFLLFGHSSTAPVTPRLAWLVLFTRLALVVEKRRLRQPIARPLLAGLLSRLSTRPMPLRLGLRQVPFLRKVAKATRSLLSPQLRLLVRRLPPLFTRCLLITPAWTETSNNMK